MCQIVLLEKNERLAEQTTLEDRSQFELSCKKCGRQFNEFDQLRMHIRGHQKVHPRALPKVRDPTLPPPESICPKCGQLSVDVFKRKATDKYPDFLIFQHDRIGKNFRRCFVLPQRVEALRSKIQKEEHSFKIRTKNSCPVCGKISWKPYSWKVKAKSGKTYRYFVYRHWRGREQTPRKCYVKIVEA